MNQTILKVEGMSCEHCVKAVKNAVSALPGSGSVNVDLKGKTVTIEHDPNILPIELIKSEIEDQGYNVLS